MSDPSENAETLKIKPTASVSFKFPPNLGYSTLKPILASSCRRCHSRKVKCSGGQPCTACKRASESNSCSYPSRNGRVRVSGREVAFASAVLVFGASTRLTHTQCHPATGCREQEAADPGWTTVADSVNDQQPKCWPRPRRDQCHSSKL